MKKNLSESILTELDRGNIMSDQNVIDICNSFSSRRNHLKYKVEGNSAIYEDGTTIKFVLNDDSEIEYYFINSQGDASKSAPVYDWSLLDSVTEEPMNESSLTSEDISTSLNNLIDKYDSLSAKTQINTKNFVYQRIFVYKGIENKNVEFIITVGKDSTIYVRILRGYSSFSPISDDFLSIMKDIKDIFSSYTLR